MSFGKEVDLERDKRMYFQSVTRHMNENPEGNQGMMLILRHRFLVLLACVCNSCFPVSFLDLQIWVSESASVYLPDHCFYCHYIRTLILLLILQFNLKMIVLH